MKGIINGRPSPAMVVALCALFVALTGVAWAATLPANSVRSENIVNGQVRTPDIAPGAINSGKVADNSLTGTDINEGTLAGVIRTGAPIPSGATVTGAYGNDGGGAGTTVSFPLRAPADIDAAHVNFAPAGFAPTDTDSACTGTANAPTAPAGKVCIYLASYSGGASSLDGREITGTNGRMGFRIDSNASAGFNDGTWAYHAP